MSTKQLQAVWELCRQGFQVTAENASRSWRNGKPFEFGDRIPLGRSLKSLIDQCNWEVEHKAERHASGKHLASPNLVARAAYRQAAGS